MSKITWLLYRLSAMSVPEIFWRLSQKRLQEKEKRLFSNNPAPVTDRVYNKLLENLVFDEKRLHLNLDNQDFTFNTTISLLGGYDYELNKMNWHSGFQTPEKWRKTFSYSLDYKQCDNIGDARTNWELNRHLQFVLLAKAYAVTKKTEYLDEFTKLFTDWNNENHFLFGISWTSVMEFAIRASNWSYAYSFLKSAGGVPSDLLNKLRIGIINMTDYVVGHYSRYSSANNHLIVEAYAIGQSGVLFNHNEWIRLGVSILTKELPLQNYSDGVNKEVSLHYQSFHMEAVGLMLRLLIKNNLEVPNTWIPILAKMCEYVADCRGLYGEYIEFGDNDDGKILDLIGGEWNHNDYVLGLLSYLLPAGYIDLDTRNENLTWLFTEEDRQISIKKPAYFNKGSICYRKGGVSILKSRDKQIQIGIDHGELGFGSIAAHGHADALSFQMYAYGFPVFIDPGTYIYHCDLESRNDFRRTKNHNTVSIDGRDQSEMLGAFLWGKRANCQFAYRADGDQITITSEHDGYKPEIHQRVFEYNGQDEFVITDKFKTDAKKELNFILPSEADIKYDELEKELRIVVNNKSIRMGFHADKEFKVSACDIPVSYKYGIKSNARKMTIETKALFIRTKILIGG